MHYVISIRKLYINTFRLENWKCTCKAHVFFGIFNNLGNNTATQKAQRLYNCYNYCCASVFVLASVTCQTQSCV